MLKSLLSAALTIVFCGSLFAQFNSDWKWSHSTPQGNTLRYIKAFSAAKWYAVGSAGTFMKTTDGGQTWLIRHDVGREFGTSGQGANANYAWFFDENKGIVVGTQGSIAITTDGGNTFFQPQTSPLTTSQTLNNIWFYDNNNGFATGNGGVLVLTNDGGNNWVGLPTGSTSNFNDVWSPDGIRIMLATSSGNIRRTTDGGATWATVNVGISATLLKMHFTTQMNGYVVGTGGTCRYTTNGGATWTSIHSAIPTTVTFNNVTTRGNKLLLTGDRDYIYQSTDNGTSWDTIRISSADQKWTNSFYCTEFTENADTMVSVGAFGLINVKMGNAPAASLMKSLKVATMNDIWAESPNGLVVSVGVPSIQGSIKDHVMRSTDGGANWSVIPLSPTSTSTLYALDMITENLGYAVGTNSAIYRTTNGGISWDSIPTVMQPGNTLRDVDFVSHTTGFVVSSTSDTTGTVWKTTDGGTTWVPKKITTATGSITSVFGISIVDSLNGWIVNYTPRPYVTTNGGETWTEQNLADGFGGFLYDIKMFNTQVGYCAGSSGRVYKTTNGGVNWDTLSVPTRAYTFNTLEFADQNTGFVMGNNGLIIFTSDGGQTWTKMNSGGSGIFGAAFVRDPQNSSSYAFFASGSNGWIHKNTMTVIPVELAAFSASVSGNNIVLNWNTVTELNNYGFEIERKSASGNWAKIGFVAGNGTTTSPKSYTFADAGLTNGKYQYRLKQIDLDGSFDYSQSVEVEIGTPITFSLSQNYPNPFNPATTIAYSIPEAADVTLKVFDVTGTEVATLVNSRQDAGSYSFNFDASKLASGMYIYKIEAGKYNAVKKMMLLK